MKRCTWYYSHLINVKTDFQVFPRPHPSKYQNPDFKVGLFTRSHDWSAFKYRTRYRMLLSTVVKYTSRFGDFGVQIFHTKRKPACKLYIKKSFVITESTSEKVFTTPKSLFLQNSNFFFALQTQNLVFHTRVYVLPLPCKVKTTLQHT